METVTITLFGYVFPAKIQPCWCCSGTGLFKSHYEDNLRGCFECEGVGHLTDVDTSNLSDAEMDLLDHLQGQMEDSLLRNFDEDEEN